MIIAALVVLGLLFFVADSGMRRALPEDEPPTVGGAAVGFGWLVVAGVLALAFLFVALAGIEALPD